MPEHKLSEQERKQIIKLIDKRRNWLDENSIQDWNKEDTLFIAVATLTREREMVKGLVEKGELLAEGAQHLFDMKKQKGSTS